MSDMRAKVRVSAVHKREDSVSGDVYSVDLTFNAVAKNGGYPEDGSDENNTFARWTPNATFTITVNNPALFDKFALGEEYYVDFTKVD